MLNFSLPIRVYIEDTDAGGIVYYANYLKYMERARTEALRAAGVELEVWQRVERRIFVVRHVTMDYLKPACLDDQIVAHVRLDTLRRASMVCEQRVTRDDQALVTARVQLACVNVDTLVPAGIPAALREAMIRER